MTELERIYNDYFRDVYLFILRLSGDARIAEEITSECFFKAMKSIDGYRGECDERVWLCQIARNCYYTYLRRARRVEYIDESALEEIPDSERSVAEECIIKDEAERINRMVNRMSEPYKSVFIFRVYAELSFKQIGGIYGKSENWACVTYHRARKNIKERVEEENNEN